MPLFQKESKTRSVIECPECNRKFYSDEYGRDNAADGCHCGNIEISLIETLEDSEYEFLIGTYYIRTPPKIYDEPLPPKEEVEVPERRIGFQNAEK